MTDDPAVTRDDRARQAWRSPAPARMHVKRRQRGVWQGIAPGGRGSDPEAVAGPAIGAKRQRKLVKRKG